MELSQVMARCQPTSAHSVTVYDRPRTDEGARVIGTVNAGPQGVEAFTPHYSLADRSAARVGGSGAFATIGDGVVALIVEAQSCAT